MRYALLLSVFISLHVFADTFTLPKKAVDIDGQPVTLESGKKGAVLVFLSARCPCSDSHVELLKKLKDANPLFNFYAIHANADEPLKETQAYFGKKSVPFPVVQDDKQKWANELGANKTPHAFILSPSGEVLYRGGVTDSHDAKAAHHQYLAESLDALAHDQKVPQPERRTLGCAISRASL